MHIVYSYTTWNYCKKIHFHALIRASTQSVDFITIGIVVAVRVPDPGVGSDPLGRDPPLQLQQQTQDYNHFFLEYPESACNVIGGDVKNHNRNF